MGITHFFENHFVKNHKDDWKLSGGSICQKYKYGILQLYIWHYLWAQRPVGGGELGRYWRWNIIMRGSSEVERDERTDWEVVFG